MTYVTEQNLTDVVLNRWKDIDDPRLILPPKQRVAGQPRRVRC